VSIASGNGAVAGRLPMALFSPLMATAGVTAVIAYSL
jgi:hypothetical protein